MTATKTVAAKKPARPSEHPTYRLMIGEAIQTLKSRSGSSRQAITKYVMANYKVGEDLTKINSRIKVALRTGIEAGAFKQAKGSGASGSFRLGEKKKAAAAQKPKKVKIPKPAATAAQKKPKSPKKKKGDAKAAKSPVKSPAKKSPSKAGAAKKVAKITKAAAKPKSPAKRGRPAKTATKSPAGKAKVAKKAAAK